MPCAPVLPSAPMPFTPPADFRVPDLRFLEIGCLVPHEREDPKRTQALTGKLQAEGVLRNPPVVAAAPQNQQGPRSQRFVVLDGANRVSTLRAAGFPHIVAQVVPYEAPSVRLSTWHHALAVDRPEELERRLSKISGLSVKEQDLSHARALLARREALAFLVRGNGSVLSLQGGRDVHRKNDLLNAIVDLYRGRHAYHRVTRDSIEEARARYPDVTCLAVFPHFLPEEILTVALAGARLPAGISRHVIAWRALRVHIPLDMMADRARGLAQKNRWLSEWMAERLAVNAVRFYEESTVLFDE
ncbi:MAG TPA: hypothetical protein VFP58_12400 [Candidatus Eisenbacteria bacterium]|nr:hypothetical protein [Candidatus Eisenbacteria bacterium]